MSRTPKSSVLRLSFADQANGDYPDSKWESEGKKKHLSLGKRNAANISNYEKFLLKTYFPAQSKRIDKAKAKNKPDTDTEATPSPAKRKQTPQPNDDEESDEGAVRVSQKKDRPTAIAAAALADNADNSEDSMDDQAVRRLADADVGNAGLEDEDFLPGADLDTPAINEEAASQADRRRSTLKQARRSNSTAEEPASATKKPRKSGISNFLFLLKSLPLY
jgi:hypothetical protein